MSNIVPIRPTSPFRALKNLADHADRVVRRCDEIDALRLYDGPLDAKRLAAAKVLAELSASDEALLTRCNEALELLDPAENYEDNDWDEGDLRRGVVKARLAILIGAFPNGAPSDPDVFVRAMLEYVCGQEGFCLPALDAACHEIITTQKFLPSISEVLKTLSEQHARWQQRLWAICDLADVSKRTLKRIEALQRKSK